MGSSFRCEVVIDASFEDTFAFFNDLSRAHEWMKGLVSMEVEPEGPVRLGTRFAETRKVMGKECTEHFEVVGFDPPRSVDMVVPSKGVNYAFRNVFEQIENGKTRATLIGEAEATSKFTGFMMRLIGMGMMRKACQRDMNAAKQCIEAEGSFTNVERGML